VGEGGVGVGDGVGDGPSVGKTVVVSVAELLSGLGSLVAAATVAVFVSMCAKRPTRTSIVTVPVAPLEKLPRLHVTVVVPEQLPELGVAEMSVTPLGLP